MLTNRLRQSVFQRFFKHDLTHLVAPEYPILLDYPVHSVSRYGYGKSAHPALLALLEAGRQEYGKRLLRFCALREALSRIPVKATADQQEPYWGQDWFSQLDAVALYGMLCEFRPKRLIEVGSGHSTKFARRAIRDHSIPTRITSIDPAPRAEIDQLCDSIIRLPLEEIDLRTFDELEQGDFLFIDASHRAFANSDVTVAFLDVLPRLRAGVIVHFHDIFWPRDYPPRWANRYYSEQYLLGACLLGDAGRDIQILMPVAFIGQDAQLAAICKPLLEVPGIRTANLSVWPFGIEGGSIWLRRGSNGTL
jgi:Methyltransferase domain